MSKLTLKSAIRFPTLVIDDLKVRGKWKRWPTKSLLSPTWIETSRIETIQAGIPGGTFDERGTLPFKYFGTWLGGRWAEAVIDMEATVLYRGLHQRFVERREWDDTCLFPGNATPIHPNEGANYGRFTISEFNKKCLRLDRLYESMQTIGWQLARTKRKRFFWLDVIYANLSAEGTLIRNTGGLHRLILSKFLGLPRVPIILHTVHADYRGVFREAAGNR